MKCSRCCRILVIVAAALADKCWVGSVWPHHHRARPPSSPLDGTWCPLLMCLEVIQPAIQLRSTVQVNTWGRDEMQIFFFTHVIKFKYQALTWTEYARNLFITISGGLFPATQLSFTLL